MMNGTTTSLHHYAHYPPPVHPLRLPCSSIFIKPAQSASQEHHSSPLVSSTASPLTRKTVDGVSSRHNGVSSLHPLHQMNKKRFGAASRGGATRTDSLKISTEDSPLANEEEREHFTQFSASPVYFPIELGSSFISSTLHASDPTPFPTAESSMVSPPATAAASRHLESFSSFMSTSSAMSSSTTPSHSSSTSLSDFASAFQTPSPSKSRHSAPILNLPRAVPLHDFDLASPGKTNNKQSARGRRAVKDEKETAERGSVSSSTSSNAGLPKGSPPALLSVLIQAHRDSLGSLPESSGSDRLSSASSLVSGFASPTLPNPSSCSPSDGESVRRVEEEESELANAVNEERLREGKLTLEADEDKMDRRLLHTPRVPQEEVDENIYDSEEEDDSGGHSDGDIDDVGADVPTAAIGEKEGPSTPARMIRAASCHSTPPKADLVSASSFFPATDYQRRSLPVMMPCTRCNRFQAGGGVKVNSADLFACKCTDKEQEEMCCATRRRGNSQRKLSKSNCDENEYIPSDANANRCQQFQSASSSDSVTRSLSHLAIRLSCTASATSSTSAAPVAAPKRSARSYMPAFVESTEDDGIMVDSSVMQFELDL